MKFLKTFLNLPDFKMFRRHVIKSLASSFSKNSTLMKRQYSTCPAGMKVTICGAAGNTGIYFVIDGIMYIY